MSRPPTHAPTATGLSRHSVGLSAAHRALIKILAEIAFKDLLAESEMMDEAVQKECHHESR